MVAGGVAGLADLDHRGGHPLWRFYPEQPPADTALPLPEEPSIAVLPFRNLSDDAEQEFFVDGLTEDLITDLAKLSGLFVISRNSVFTYKGQRQGTAGGARAGRALRARRQRPPCRRTRSASPPS